MDSKKEFEGTKEDSSCVKVKIEFEVSLDDCVPKTLNKIGLMLIQHGQALILANDSSKACMVACHCCQYTEKMGRTTRESKSILRQ